MATIIKNEVLIRVYIVMLVLVALAVTIFSKAVFISTTEGKYWRGMGDSLYVRYMPIEPVRGNIFATDGSLLATSLPYYEIRFDPNANNITDAVFANNVDSLGLCISYINNMYTAGGWRDYLKICRAKGERYVLVKERATIEEYDRIKRFPLFRLGKYKGGLIAAQKNNREHPFGSLGLRTIGYVKDDLKIGLEGFYDNIVGGSQGKELMHRVGRDIWLPMNNLTEVQPKNGDDITTTLDINLQDITQEALLRSLDYHDADAGCAIVMEVKTGAIRAMANMGRTQEGWGEIYNYAVGRKSEPGSTFKLASMLSLLEDDFVNLDDTIDLNYGKTRFYERDLEDAEKHGLKITTVRHAFEISSNVGISKLMQRYYGENKRAAKFIAHLKDFNLDKVTGIDLSGEAEPFIKEAYDSKYDWSGTTLPWMSIGYETALTPLQMLNLYNAVANDGQMMQPYLLSDIQRFGEVIKTFKPTIVKRKIASKKSIAKMKEMLEGVVLNGTMKDYKTTKYNYAGKTGTAQVNYSKLREQDDKGYQASFAGYFPAENPVYSCIVVVYNPKQYGYFGASCAGSVFREIADKAFTTKTELHQSINRREKPVMTAAMLPQADAGTREDIDFLLDHLNFRYYTQSKKDFVSLKLGGDSLKMIDRSLPENVVPNVVGMRLKDALYVLENRGMKVGVNGYGVVRRQSVPPGTKAVKGTYIALGLE
jgi:cell division protein FtsI (penicillin-binding protein 3)